MFEASYSNDGRAWSRFATYLLSLPPANTVGFVASPSKADALATAKFAGVRLLIPDLTGATPTNAAPATAVIAVRSAPHRRI